MKKIFNLAVSFAALMSAFTFASCTEDEEKAIDEAVKEGKAYVQVAGGEKVNFYNEAVDGKGGVIEIGDVKASEDDKTVTFTIATKKDPQKKTPFTIGQSKELPSYFGWDGTTFKTYKQADATANPDQIILCVASKPSEIDATVTDAVCILTSATINKGVKDAAAAKGITLKETLFSIK